jgi:hypothetical protein
MAFHPSYFLNTLALIIGGFLSVQPTQAGAFLFPEGHGQLIVSTSLAEAQKAFDGRGRLINTEPYRKFETSAYFEYGLRDWLTVVGSGNGMRFHGSAEGAASYSGLGLGAVGLRARLMQIDDYLVSGEVSVRAATRAARFFLDMREQLQPDARLLFGRALEVFGKPAFLDLQLGYRPHGQYGDELRADATFGVRPLPWLLVMAQSFSAVSLSGGMASQKLELSGVIDASPQVSFQLGLIGAVAGLETPSERGLVAAMWVRF